MTSVTRLTGGGAPAANFVNITAAAPTTTVVATTPCTLRYITFNKPVATGVVTLYHGPTVAAGVVFGIITTPASPIPVTLEYHIALPSGLTITSATAAQDITVVWD